MMTLGNPPNSSAYEVFAGDQRAGGPLNPGLFVGVQSVVLMSLNEVTSAIAGCAANRNSQPLFPESGASFSFPPSLAAFALPPKHTPMPTPRGLHTHP